MRTISKVLRVGLQHQSTKRSTLYVLPVDGAALTVCVTKVWDLLTRGGGDLVISKSELGQAGSGRTPLKSRHTG
ncbi:hypothetical protein IRJ41_018796, partial [Triplophysa rosa]